MVKLVQFLKEAAPRLRSVAVFVNPTNAAAAPMVEKVRSGAASLGMQVQNVEVSSKSDFEAAFAAIRRANTESILLPPEPLIRANRGAIADFARLTSCRWQSRAAAVYLPASGLISYGPTTTQYAQSAPGTSTDLERYPSRRSSGRQPSRLNW